MNDESESERWRNLVAPISIDPGPSELQRALVDVGCEIERVEGSLSEKAHGDAWAEADVATIGFDEAPADATETATERGICVTMTRGCFEVSVAKEATRVTTAVTEECDGEY